MLKVKKKCCGKCLFGKNKIVSDARKVDIISSCTRNDHHFECHEGTIAGEEIVCHAFYNKYTSQMIRIAQRLNFVEFVN